MLLKIGYEVEFDILTPTAMLLLLYVHPSRTADLIEPESVIIEPQLPIEIFTDWFGNRCGRILAPTGKLNIQYNNVIKDTGLPEPVFLNARQNGVEELPVETLEYLLPSRYCEVDRLSDIAWKLFSQSPFGWGRVQAICDFVYAHVQFGYDFARPTKTAWEVYQEGNGVCRDFMHLALTFCRCMNIPARYATGYLGDIGVPLTYTPMDFSAFFEVYLDGQWHPFDARHNARRIGRVPMAYGRDAADAALTTSFGATDLTKFYVWTDEVPGVG